MGKTKWSKPPPRELFLFPLQMALDPTRLETIEAAYEISKHGHAGQKRLDGSRQFDHPKAAAWIYIGELGGRDPRAIIDALLHDLKEDSYILSLFRVKLNFGEEIAADVRALTKLAKGKETTEEYLARIIAQGPWAILAKLCDRLHNLRTLGSCPEEMRKEQIEETERYHLPLLIPALAGHGEPWSRYAAVLDEKIREVIEAYR